MTTLSQASITIGRLRAELAGQVIGPDDAEYDAARTVFSPLFDRRPAVIVRPVDAGEIGDVLSLARESGLELAVRSGGHSGAGHGVAREASSSTSRS
jgi:FAD/FMN-containing dehydrogenase